MEMEKGEIITIVGTGVDNSSPAEDKAEDNEAEGGGIMEM